MSVFKRGGCFYYEFVFHGRRIKKSTGLTNKQAAKQAEAIRKADLATARSGIHVVDPPLFADFVSREFLPWAEGTKKWNTYDRYRCSSKPLMKHFTVHVDDINPALVERFKMNRVKECSPAGVNRDLAALRAMMNFAMKQDYVRKNPVCDVKFLPEGPGCMRVVSHDEERRYLAAADPALRDVAILMLQTGMRPNEVFHVRDEHVNFREGFLFVPSGKTSNARRTIPLTPLATLVLRRRFRSGFLFPHRDDPSRGRTACRTHELVVRKLGLDFRLYDLRHTFASRSVMAGVDLATLKELMGHSTISMTMRYTHPTPDHKVAAIRKLVAFNESTQKSPQCILASA